MSYDEGNWFAVPLTQGGYALGLVARTNGRGTALGYFFLPVFPDVPDSTATVGLQAADAILVRLFGDLALINGEWRSLRATSPGQGLGGPYQHSAASTLSIIRALYGLSTTKMN